MQDAGRVLQQPLVEKVLQPRGRQVVWRVDEGAALHGGRRYQQTTSSGGFKGVDLAAPQGRAHLQHMTMLHL